MTTDVVSIEQQENSMSVAQVVAQAKRVEQIMKEGMEEGVHFGIIPGSIKPSLLKAGAEKLCLLFGIDAQPEEQVIDLGNGHRECRMKVQLYSIATGRRLGAGVGTCSTMETKYRYRAAWDYTDKPAPSEYWKHSKTDMVKALDALGGKGFAAKKNPDGQWVIAKNTGERSEYADPADYYNTVTKMAKKRALVDAVLTRTAASDIFTQDLEELVDEKPGGKKEAPTSSTAGKKEPEENRPKRKSDTAAAPADSGELSLKGKIQKGIAQLSGLSGQEVRALLREASKIEEEVTDENTGEVKSRIAQTDSLEELIKSEKWALYTLARIEKAINELKGKAQS